jgi:hypothetical protein
MDLLPFFQWCYTTPVGEGIRESTWMFPVIEAVHLLGFGLTAGAVLLVDLRLLGVGLSRQPAAELWANAKPWMLGSLTLMFVSGIPLVLAESMKCYYSFAFWIKMTALFLVILFTFTIVRQVTQTSPAADRPRLRKFTAFTSMGLWFLVAWGGRWIGFS